MSRCCNVLCLHRHLYLLPIAVQSYNKVSRWTQYTLIVSVSVGQLSTQLNRDLGSWFLTGLQLRYRPWLWSNLKAGLRKGLLPSSRTWLLAGFSFFRAVELGTSVMSCLWARGCPQDRASWALPKWQHVKIKSSMKGSAIKSSMKGSAKWR